MIHLKIPTGQSATIEIPGLTAIRVDAQRRIIAIDNISGKVEAGESLGPEWTVHDFRDGTYGDFHRLKPAEDCFDADCARRGEHDFETVNGD